MCRPAIRSAHGIRAAMVLRAMPEFAPFIAAGGLLAVTTCTSAESLSGSHGVVIKAGALMVACVAIGLLLGIRLLSNLLRRRSRFSTQVLPNEGKHEEPWI